MAGKTILHNKFVALLLIVGAVYFFLKYISPLATPVIVAALFLTVCYPKLDDIQRRFRLKKQYMAAGILLWLGSIIFFLLWLCVDFLIHNIGGFQVMLSELLTRLEQYEWCSYLIDRLDIYMDSFQTKWMPTVVSEAFNYVKYLGMAGAFLALTAIATLLLAKDYDEILSKVGADKNTRVLLEISLKVIRYIATYIKAQLLIMAIIGTVCVVALCIAGVEYGYIWGTLAGFLDMLPFIGTGIVLVPLSIWQFLQGAYVKGAVCLVVYGVCALIREFLEPRLIGKKEGIYPVLILIAVYGGVRLFGISGIIKGPIAIVLIKETYLVYQRLVDAHL